MISTIPFFLQALGFLDTPRSILGQGTAYSNGNNFFPPLLHGTFVFPGQNAPGQVNFSSNSLFITFKNSFD